MADILEELRKAERDALSPSNREFYKRAADEVERLRTAAVGVNVGVDLEDADKLGDADATECTR